MPDIDYLELFGRIGFLLEGICLVFVGKFLRDLFYLARGYELKSLITSETGPAAAVDLCGFLLAMTLATTNSIITTKSSWVGQASDIALTGLLVSLLLLVADWITDKAIFRKMDDYHEIYQANNISLSIGRLGNMIATGLIVSSALGDAGTRAGVLANLPHCLFWFFFGQLALILVSLVYQAVTPYEDLEQIRSNNIAAAIPIAAIQIAIGMTIHAGLHGTHQETIKDVLAVSFHVLIATVLLYVLRTLADKLLAPRARLSEEIELQKNVGAGLIEGTSFLIGGIILSYFLT